MSRFWAGDSSSDDSESDSKSEFENESKDSEISSADPKNSKKKVSYADSKKYVSLGFRVL